MFTQKLKTERVGRIFVKRKVVINKNDVVFTKLKDVSHRFDFDKSYFNTYTFVN